jgi:hypothetical protein
MAAGRTILNAYLALITVDHHSQQTQPRHIHPQRHVPVQAAFTATRWTRDPVMEEILGVYRPQYKDKKTGKMKYTKIWYYEFIFAGRLIKESSKSSSKTVAKEAEKRRRRELEAGFNGLADARDERIRTISAFAHSFLEEYKVRHPKSATFAEYALGHIGRLAGELMVVDVTDKVILKYQTDRLRESAARRRSTKKSDSFCVFCLWLTPGQSALS